MKCSKTSRLMTDMLAGELSAIQAKQLEEHLAACENCRKEFDELREIWNFTGDALRRNHQDLKLSDAHRREIFEAAADLPKLKLSKKMPPKFRWLELAASLIVGIILLGLLLPTLSSSREKSRRIYAESNLKRVGLSEGGALPAVGAPPDLETDSSAAPAALTGPESATFGGAGADKDADKGGAAGKLAAENRKDVADVYLRRAAAGPTGGPALQALEEKPAVRDEKAFAALPPMPPLPPAKAAKVAFMKYKANQSFTPAAAPAASRYAYGVATIDKMDKAEVKQESLKLSEEQASNVLIWKGVPEAKSLAASDVLDRPAESSKKKEEFAASEAFKVNLKLWNLTTVEDVRDFLKSRNCPAPAKILIDTNAGTIRIDAPYNVMTRIRNLVETLNNEEKRLKDFKDGLPFIKTESKPFSTFSIDTDTASYLTAKKNINRGIRPDPSKIRAEDFINYFDYHYRSPENSVFAVNMESAPAPFRPQNTLLRIGVQGKRLGPNMNSASVYTVLLDTSGSMAYGERMELAVNALKLLSTKMTPYDRLSLVTCGGSANVLVNNQMKTKNTLDMAVKAIEAGGVSDFYNGLRKAYQLAAVNYRAGAWNRVVIITDGIVKLEPEARAGIIGNIEKNRINGISNIVIGLGGDGDDKLLEEIAATGDGSYVFVDSENDVKELFAANFEARFREIARDVKIQVEFNPENVAEYRQIGYENRQLSKADFRNDSVDAGEVGSGQSVTALYELRLKPGVKPDATIATTRIRYKNAEDMRVEEKSFVIDAGNIGRNFETASPGFKLASFAAEFAEGLEYPETQNIATPSGIAVKLRQLQISNYSKDEKVRELLDLVSRVR